MLKYNSRNWDSFNYGSWDHVTNEEIMGRLTYNDEIRTFYTSYNTIEDGINVINGVSLRLPTV